ncbi:MAG: ribosomal-processing cysteine protease Prp [Lachnospiraceae bacterium]|nr:ribosomal-processing cysteine protease Prp [Lachnospiraceae bacterium]
MTKVALFVDDEGAPRGFEVSDHAGFADKGSDIVCAALSILTINTINGILEYTGQQPEVIEDTEHSRISCMFRDPPNEKSSVLLKTFFLGIRSIGEQYRDYVQIFNRRYQ